MLIGIIGLNCKEFNDYCKQRGCFEYSYGFKDQQGNEYFHITEYTWLAGRKFDKILDLDAQRLELLTRISNLEDYLLGGIPLQNKVIALNDN